jgi:hypothetical protein
VPGNGKGVEYVCWWEGAGELMEAALKSIPEVRVYRVVILDNNGKIVA